MSSNPYKPGDFLSIQRGTGWLTGEVVKVVLARCHIQIDGRVFVEDYHNCRPMK